MRAGAEDTGEVQQEQDHDDDHGHQQAAAAAVGLGIVVVLGNAWLVRSLRCYWCGCATAAG